MLASAEQDGRGHYIDERNLFDGTDSLNTCRAICANNFDIRTGGLYGHGSHFAVHAEMINHSTKKYLPTDIRFMFRAKVLVGQFTKGNSFFRRPPEIPGQVYTFYDSCVDKIQNPNTFVVFDRNQCYPEYLIMYADREKISMDKMRNSSNLQMHTVQSIAFPINSVSLSYDGDPLTFQQPTESQTSLKCQSCVWLSSTCSDDTPAVHLNDHRKIISYEIFFKKQNH